MADITASPSDANIQHPLPVVQYVYLESDPARRSEMSSLLIASAARVGTEPGCIKYRVSADMTKPGAFHLFEHWRTEEDLGRHESSPETREMLGRMAAAGGRELQIVRFDVLGSHTSLMSLSPEH